MEKILRRLDRLFNRIFGSEYNPLYSSGTIAIVLLAMATASGLYLCFFYRLGEPYESILAIQNGFPIGRWIRSIHRYSSDGMIVAVGIHIFRMIAQGKTWGPRTLAWITGVGLLVFTLVSGWTGFVMVWDAHGQVVAVNGAKMMDAIGIFPDPIGRSFDGSSAPPASFFFLNLFLHIVIPLSMIFGVWLHTAKMANAVWFPSRHLTRAIVAILALSSFLWPAPLAEKADLLRSANSVPLNWFYNFWLPVAQSHPLVALSILTGGILGLASIPLWLKPRREKRREKSFNEQKNCQGCTQCVQDCPYEAIAMVPRTEGAGSAEVARVDPDRCVSCGICAASCAPFTMGPPGRKGSDQFAAARFFLAQLRAKKIEPKSQVLIVGCSAQKGVAKSLREFGEAHPGFQFYPVECAGTVHAATLEYLARNFKSLTIAACPSRICTNKDGHRLLSERLNGTREPAFEYSENRAKVTLLTAGEGEEAELLQSLRMPESALRSPGIGKRAIRVCAGLGLALALSAAGRATWSEGRSGGFLRLSFRLSGQAAKNCRERSAEELKALPQHMRTAQICEQKMLAYRLGLTVDGRPALDRVVEPGGLHSDRPIYVEDELPLEPGSHTINVSFAPADSVAGASSVSLGLEKEIKIRAGRAVLVHLSADQENLLVKGDQE
jgi:ferredoxin